MMQMHRFVWCRHLKAILAGALLGFVAMTNTAHADTITLYAAGSLKGALSDVIKAYETSTGHKVETKFGPSGFLKDELAGGGKADVFASVNMIHPQALHDAGKSGPVTRFARNTLCALVRPGLEVSTRTLLDRMLEPTVKLATSTPKRDPAGDYAFEAFSKADKIKPGAQAVLEKKALMLTGGKESATPPRDRIVYGWHVAEGRADIFLTYCTNALAAQRQYAGQQRIELPADLSVGADYGLTVMNGATVQPAKALIDYILSAEGQKILAGYGFASGNSRPLRRQGG
jgi:ABC-type molybdate transport system substrate-binding protein